MSVLSERDKVEKERRSKRRGRDCNALVEAPPS